MIYKQNKKIVLGLLLTLFTGGWADAEVQEASKYSGRRISGEYLGTRTTRELNQNNSCLIRSRVGKSNKPQVPKVPPMPGQVMKSSHAKTSPVQQIGLNFTAATVANAPQTDVIPLNATGWIGEKQFVLMSYQAITSFDKNTGNPDGILETDAGSFFNGNANDVRIEYDRFSRRWFVTAELNNNLSLAVSNSSLITDSTKWTFFQFPNSQIIPQINPLGSGFIDYNQLAIDRNAVYVSMDTFNGSGYFLGTSTLVIQKSSLFDGSPNVTVFNGIVPDALQFATFTPPADNFDKHAEFGYLIHASNQAFSAGNTFNQLYLYRIVNPGSDSPTLFGPILIEVPNYSEPSNAPHEGNLYGANGFLQTGLFGGLMAPHVRDKQLFACHPILVDSTGAGNPTGDRVGVRWYQIDLTGNSNGSGQGGESQDTIPALVQSGTLFDSSLTSPLFYYIPSIMTNKKQDLVISATVSGANAFTNVAFAGRRKKDASGTLRAPVLLTNNSINMNPYNFGPLLNLKNANIGQRWGDESSLSPDPVKDLDIWSTGEYAAVENGWGVQVTQIKPLKKNHSH